MIKDYSKDLSGYEVILWALKMFQYLRGNSLSFNSAYLMAQNEFKWFSEIENNKNTITVLWFKYISELMKKHLQYMTWDS